MEHGGPDPALTGLGIDEFRSVFRVPTDDDEPFQPWLERKEVLFLADLASPTEPFVSRGIFDAMLDAGIETGRRACFAGYFGEPELEPPLAVVTSYDEYGVLLDEWFLQHCLFGLTGTWGCVTGETRIISS